MPSASGSSSVSAYADTWSTPSADRRARASSPRSSSSCPGTSYSRSTETERIPRRAPRRPRRRRRPAVPPAEPPEQGRLERLGAERQPRSRPRRAAPARRRARPGPGSTSIVTSAPSAMPKRSRTASRIASIDAGGSRRRRPAAEVHGLERRASGLARRARSRVGLVRPERRARSQRARRTRPPRAGPRAAAPAYTTKSQYGQSETQNGTWT